MKKALAKKHKEIKSLKFLFVRLGEMIHIKIKFIWFKISIEIIALLF